MGAVLYPEAMKTRVGCYEYNEKWPDFHTVHGRRSPSPTARRQDGRKRQLFVMQYIAPSPAGCRCRMARAYVLVDEIVLCNGHTNYSTHRQKAIFALGGVGLGIQHGVCVFACPTRVIV